MHLNQIGDFMTARGILGFVFSKMNYENITMTVRDHHNMTNPYNPENETCIMRFSLGVPCGAHLDGLTKVASQHLVGGIDQCRGGLRWCSGVGGRGGRVAAALQQITSHSRISTRKGNE